MRGFGPPLILLVVTGCGRILGVDEYRVRPGDAGTALPIITDLCGDHEVRTDEGACEQVGVPPTSCDANGFELGADGACMAILPAEDCTEGLAFPGSPACDTPPATPPCDPDQFPSLGAMVADGVTYASIGAPASCTPRGSRDCPFATIAGALAAVARTQRPMVFVHSGRYEEDLVVSTPDVVIRGCEWGAPTEIVGLAETLGPHSPCLPPGGILVPGAAICVAPGVTGVRIEGVRLTGKGAGLIATSAEVRLSTSMVMDTGSAGILALDARTEATAGAPPVPAIVTLSGVAVLRAGGVGAATRGSTLKIDQSSIQATRMLNAAPAGLDILEVEKLGAARGVAAYASGFSASATSADPADFAQADVEISRSAITGNEEGAVFASGATLKVTSSFIGALRRGAPSGRGIVVERSVDVGTAAEAIIDGTVIEGTRDTAVEVRDAALTLTNTTIRDVAGRLGDGCSGQGIRVRTFPTSSEPSKVVVDRTSLLGTRQSAIFAASSSVKVTSTLVRDMAPPGTGAPCARAMGDGIDVEQFPGAPEPSLELRRVRIDGASRAAVSIGAGELVTESTNVTCSGKNLVSARAASAVAGTLCGCGPGRLATCAMEATPLVPWASAGPSAAWPSASVTCEVCPTGFLTSRPVGGVSWMPDRAEVVPAPVRANDCALLAGLLPSPPPTFAHWVPSFNAFGRRFEAPAINGAYDAAPQLLGLQVINVLRYSVALPAAVIAGAYPGTASGVPAGSRLRLDPFGTFIDRVGKPLTDGVVTQTDFYVAVARDPGWHTVTLEPPPGAECLPVPGRADPLTASVRMGVVVGQIVGFACSEPPAP